MYLARPHIAAIAAGALLLSAGMGVALAGWLDHGAQIFMSMAESGLSWCF